MHYFGTVNLDIISEFITTGIFFFFFFLFQLEVHNAGAQVPDQTTPPACSCPNLGNGACHSARLSLSNVGLFVFQLSIQLCFTFQARSVQIPSCILMSSPLLASLLLILCIRLCRRYSRRH